MRAHGLTYILLLVVILGACGGGGTTDTPDAPPSDLADAPPPTPDASTVVVLPTGTVTEVTYTTNCISPAGQDPIGSTGQQFRCAQLTISCPGLDDAAVQVALAPTPATASKGTIITHSGAGGQSFMRSEIAAAVHGRGWDLAQIAWEAPWECPLHENRQCGVDFTPVPDRRGIKDAACRPATVVKWIREEAQRRDGSPFVAGDAPMCGHGFSGGSGALWYALAHYGASAWLDFAQVGASTPFARIDIGCDPANATTTVPAACDNLDTSPEVPVTYDANGAMSHQALNAWFSTDACDAAPTPDDLAMFARNSIVSAGADLAFATPVSAYVCVDDATVNVVPGMGHYMQAALTGDQFTSACVVNGVNGTCQGEGVFTDPAMRDAAIAELDAACVPLDR
jgi:hypothetical protein